MNIITKTENGYFCTTTDGQRLVCNPWYEKSKNKWHLVLPKGNPTGRTYIVKSLVDDNGGIYEFEDKTTGPRVIGSTSWRSRLTQEELDELKLCEDRIEELKKIGMERKPVELTPEEKLLKEIERLSKKYEILTGKQI